MKQIINRQSSAATDLKDRQQAKQYTGTAADGTGHQKAKQCSNRLLTDRQQAKQYTGTAADGTDHQWPQARNKI